MWNNFHLTIRAPNRVTEVEVWTFVCVVKLFTLSVTFNGIRPDFYMNCKYEKWVTKCD